MVEQEAERLRIQLRDVERLMMQRFDNLEEYLISSDSVPVVRVELSPDVRREFEHIHTRLGEIERLMAQWFTDDRPPAPESIERKHEGTPVRSDPEPADQESQ